MRQFTALFWISACLWLASVISVSHAQTATTEERLLKAVFIYNFAKFTRWPESAWRGESEPLVMCTSGKNELVDALEQLSGKTVHGRPVTVLPLADDQSPVSCHALYIGQSDQRRYLETIASVKGVPVLTISEVPKFVDAGGIIELYRERGRIRFIINLDAAREAGLEFSSRLLDLAVVVNRENAR